MSVLSLRSTRPAAAFAGALVLLAANAMASPASVLGVTTTCVVRNTATGDTQPNLTAAITRASPGDELRLKGTCPSVIIGKGVTVVGIQPTGYGTPTLARSSGTGRVVHVKRGVTATIRGITIRGGKALGAGAAGNSGGGILNEGTLTLRQVVVRDNRALASGGGIHNRGTLVLMDSHVRSNTLTKTGGNGNGCGIASTGAVTIRGTSTVRDNHPTGDGCNGGGIHLASTGSLVMEDTAAVRDNTNGGASGAGVASYGGTITLRESARIHGNSALPGGAGGGVYQTSGSELTMRGSSSIDHNGAMEGAGVDSYGTVHLYGTSSIHHNDATTQGGGILDAGTVVMDDASTIHHNTAPDGGGLLVTGGLTMNDTSLVNRNTASVAGGGIWNGCDAVNTGVVGGVNVIDNTPQNVFSPSC